MKVGLTLYTRNYFRLYCVYDIYIVIRRYLYNVVYQFFVCCLKFCRLFGIVILMQYGYRCADVVL